MKTTITILAITFSAITGAQTLSTGFEGLPAGANTAYSPTTSTPFYDAGCRFQYTWDAGFSDWSGGFAYTNKADSVTPGYTNLYGVRTLHGYSNSATYVVGQDHAVITPTIAGSRINGFYLTNTTYAYKSMVKGDQFAKKFGGTSGNDPDFLKVVIKSYRNGAYHDSVEFFLADFRFTDNSQDYILNTWKYVDVSGLGQVDSVRFVMRSSDNSNGYMNTPAFFGLDEFSMTSPFNTGIKNEKKSGVTFFPNPATDVLYLNYPEKANFNVAVRDLTGREVIATCTKDEAIALDFSSLAKGVYIATVSGEGFNYTSRVVKQ